MKSTAVPQKLASVAVSENVLRIAKRLELVSLTGSGYLLTEKGERAIREYAQAIEG